MSEVSPFIAFAAGLLSFLSPCVLPLIPSYLFFIGGTAQGDGAGKLRIFARTGFFVAGFSAVFIVLSILVSTVLLFFNSKYFDIAAGTIVIVLGFNIIFDFLKFLNYEKRPALKKPASLIGAFVAGAAFGAGWTPCVGPILGSILLLAGRSGSLPFAAFCLVLYSAGFGIPFLAAAFFFDRFLSGAAFFKKHLRVIQIASGILLIATGILMVSGRFSALGALLAKWQSAKL
jgi:cytochrome c-type biogenesis protein